MNWSESMGPPTKAATDQAILGAYRAMEEVDPDISTERLLAMTADAAGVSYERVVAALLRQSDAQADDDAEADDAQGEVSDS